MTRKCIVLFFIIAFCSFILLNGVFGEHGIIASRQMKKELDSSQEEIQTLQRKIDDLEKQKVSSLSDDGLKDSALKLGYQIPGDKVYYFGDKKQEDTPVSTEGSEQNIVQDKRENKTVSTGEIVLISIMAGFLTALLYLYILKREENTKYDSESFQRRRKSKNSDLTE